MKKLLLLSILPLFLLSCEKKTTTKGSVFRIANGADPQSLDPAKVQGVPEHRLMLAMFEGLMVYDPTTSDPIIGLAARMPEISDDRLTYTFTLREDLKWNDGAPLTAYDFEYGMKRTLDPATASNYASMLYVIQGAEEFNSGTGNREDVKVNALDDLTLQIVLNHPTAYFLSLVAHYTYYPHPRHVIEKYGDDWTKVGYFVSNGSFMVKEWVINSKVELVKNPLFYDAENVKLDRVVYYSTDDDSTAYNMFRQGEIDWNTGLFPANIIDEVRLRDDTHISTMLGSVYYTFNVLKKPFDDPRVRKALSMSLNRQELVDKILKDGSVATANLVPTLEGYPSARGNDFNPEVAKKLLAEAGFPNGADFPAVELLYNTNDKHRVVAEWAQAQWKENLGIDVQLRNEEWKVFLESRSRQRFDIARNGWSGDYKDPMTFLDLFVTGVALNDGRYSSKAYDRLLQESNNMPSGEPRYKVLLQAEELLVYVDQGIIPMYYLPNINLIDLNKWGGWSSNLMDIHPIKTIYKK